MKTDSITRKNPTSDPRAAQILNGLRQARKSAVKTAKATGTPIVYLQDGKLVRERP